MDTSETYIKMRLAAIPDLGYGVEFTRYTLNDYVGPLNLYIDAKGDVYYLAKFTETQDWCQLERQDQLQEMVKYYHNLPPAEYSTRGKLEVFWEFVDEHWIYLHGTLPEMPSMEQLWLAFVMKEKGKTWDSAKWV